MAIVNYTVNYYKGYVTSPTDASHFLGSATGSAESGSTMQTTDPATTATYIDLDLEKETGWSSGTLLNTNLVLSVTNYVFSVYYTATLPSLPPTAPVDPFALSPTDQATFYNWITSKYAVTATTNQPVNNVALSYPPKTLSVTDPGYSPDYASFISEYNYIYIGSLQGYDPSNDWEVIPTPPVE